MVQDLTKDADGHQNVHAGKVKETKLAHVRRIALHALMGIVLESRVRIRVYGHTDHNDHQTEGNVPKDGQQHLHRFLLGEIETRHRHNHHGKHGNVNEIQVGATGGTVVQDVTRVPTGLFAQVDWHIAGHALCKNGSIAPQSTVHVQAQTNLVNGFSAPTQKHVTEFIDFKFPMPNIEFSQLTMILRQFTIVQVEEGLCT